MIGLSGCLCLVINVFDKVEVTGRLFLDEIKLMCQKWALQCMIKKRFSQPSEGITSRMFNIGWGGSQWYVGLLPS